jgi:hypothetical protein
VVVPERDDATRRGLDPWTKTLSGNWRISEAGTALARMRLTLWKVSAAVMER